MIEAPYRLAVGLAAAVVCAPATASAQFREPPRTPAYALENVTVVHADGTREPGVNIVVRGTVIEAMGAGIPIPGDAEVLEGDSLLVYPGLVDGQGTAETTFPEIERSDSVRSWNAPRDIQGMLAHRRVVDYLGRTDGADQRAAGIVAAGIHPEDALAAGLSATIVYRPDVDYPWQLVATEDIGLSMAFKGAQGAYPGTLFGIIAYMRQAFEDARYEQMKHDAYVRNPASGVGMPSVDPDYAVLRRAMAGEIPVYFEANRAEDIRRVLGLSDEYGIRPIIVGGHEAWRVTDELVERRVPVLIDGDFPDRKDWKEPEEVEEAEVPDSAAIEPIGPAEPEVLEPAAAREKKRLENIWSNAGRLEAAGVVFAITTGGGDANMREAARLSMEYGLSEAAALHSVTAAPAGLLGIPSVARVDQGMPATFVAVTGPLFDEDTDVAYTFVEGSYERGASGDAGGGAPAVVVTGNWTITLTAMGQEFPMEASLTMEPDGAFDGTVENDMFGSAPISGHVSGDNISFTISISAGGQEVDLTCDGTVEGDSMSGSGESAFGSLTFTGKKNPGGAR